jgi:hypothetical protein
MTKIFKGYRQKHYYYYHDYVPKGDEVGGGGCGGWHPAALRVR